LQRIGDLQQQLIAKEEREQLVHEKVQEISIELNESRTTSKQLEIKFEAERKAARVCAFYIHS